MSFLKAFSDSLPDSYITTRIRSISIFSPENLSRRRLLVVAGIHGDEPAGCFGILKFLNQPNIKELLDRLSVSFIPVVNEYGFENNKRKNEENKDINRNFDSEEKSSKETKSILRNSSLIYQLAKDGFLTLHEDDTKDKFYFYTYGKNQKLFDMILKTGKKFLEVQQGKINGKNIENGRVKDMQDNSLEQFLADNECLGITTETPTSKKLDFRIEINRQLINTFLQYFLL